MWRRRRCPDFRYFVFAIIYLFSRSRYALAAADATITTHITTITAKDTKRTGGTRTFPIFVQTTKRLSLMKRYDVSSRVHFSFFSLFIRFSFGFLLLSKHAVFFLPSVSFSFFSDVHSKCRKKIPYNIFYSPLTDGQQWGPCFLSAYVSGLAVCI